MNTVIVSGASGNLGSAVSKYFIEQSSKVIGLVHYKGEKNKTTSQYQELEVDLLKEEDTQGVVAQCINRYGNIDAAVLTAGGFTGGNMQNTSAPELEKYFMLNFETAFNLAKPLFSHMKENGKGKLFFIGSGTGMDTKKGKNTVAYSLSKSMLFQLANIINAEMEETGVQAHVIVPGTIDTPPNREAMPNADFETWEKPEDIAAIVEKYARKENNLLKTVLIVKEELQ